MRPNAPHNPAVESVEKCSDVGFLVVLAPSPQDRIKFLNQLLGLERYAPLGKLAYPIHEFPDRLLTRVSIQRPRLSTTTDLARRQSKLPSALDLVPKKFESVPDVHDPRLLRMQLHSQFVQNPKRYGYRRPRFCCRFAGHYPVSSPGESHPEALSEPYLNLSAHTAPAMEPRRTPICQCANSFGSRREMRATQCVARRKCPRNFLYFR